MTDERQMTIADVGAMPEEVTFSGEIHPVADLFPMMTGDELDDLAADIKANGLIHPIVLDDSGALIDGRNRHEGCRRAEVQPTFTRMNGRDPVAFILSSNIARRHLKKGQQALMVMIALKEKCNQGSAKQNGKSATVALVDASSAYGVSERYLKMAGVVIRYAPTLAENVMSTAMELPEAYEKAKAIKEEGESPEAKLTRLEATNPELAALVRSGDLTLAGAIAEAVERKRRQEEVERAEEERIERLTRRFNQLLTSLEPPAACDPEEWAKDWLNADPAVMDGDADFSAERALRAADTLTRYARLKGEQENGQPKATEGI